MAAVDARTVYRLEAAMSEIHAKADELEQHAERIAALLSPPDRDPPFDHPLSAAGMP
jgi:hypothetical protein